MSNETFTLSVARKRIGFKTVLQAFSDLSIPVIPEPEGPNAEPDPRLGKQILIWDDSLHLFCDPDPRSLHNELNYFAQVRDWQVINRIPRINIICRKVDFVETLHRSLGRFYPDKLDFLPESFNLTIYGERQSFAAMIKERKAIIKPTDGSLGKGIQIIEAGTTFDPKPSANAVGQAYIESAQVNHRKFDLRVYALIIATKPLTLLVYRNGIARVCSDPVSANTVFSQITNTAVNIEHADASLITFMISEIFETLKQQHGIEPETLWNSIDSVIARTIFAASETILERINEIDQERRPRIMPYPRYFQILGFDILLDQQFKPWILEVNYRPSLEFGTPDEWNMKVKLLKEMILIAAPYEAIEIHLLETRGNPNAVAIKTWLDRKPVVMKRIKSKQQNALQNSQFVMVLCPENWTDFVNQLGPRRDPMGKPVLIPKIVKPVPKAKQKKSKKPKR